MFGRTQQPVTSVAGKTGVDSLDMFLQRRRRLFAHQRAVEGTVRRHQPGCRQGTGQADGQMRNRLGRHHRHADVETLHHSGQFSGAQRVVTDRQHVRPPGMLTGKTCQLGQFLATGCTPLGPEIEHQPAALVIGQTFRCAVEQMEFRRRLTGTEKKQQQAGTETQEVRHTRLRSGCATRQP